MSSNTVAEDLVELATESGARLVRFRKYVDLVDLQRKKLSWFSKNIQLKMGVAPKPAAGSTCPLCRTPQQAFELDHMGPWRIYVAALAGPHVQHGSNGEMMISPEIVKVLYNDPDNLWWICHSCNNKKSDQTYDTADQLAAIENGEVPKGEKRVDPTKMMD